MVVLPFLALVVTLLLGVPIAIASLDPVSLASGLLQRFECGDRHPRDDALR